MWGSHSLGRPRKRWIDTVKECLKKRGLDIRQARRMVQDRSQWRWFDGLIGDEEQNYKKGEIGSHIKFNINIYYQFPRVNKIFKFQKLS